jgi:dihydroflavonol-4-reductase
MRLALSAAALKSVIDHKEPELSLAKYRRAFGDLLVNDQKARRELGYGRTDLHTMLAATVSWLEEEHLITVPTAEAGGLQHG